MPVILSQHFLATDREYEDVEYGLYHYPRQYFGRVKPYDSFIYYRPLGESQRRDDSLHYFGYGVLGQPFADPMRPDHRFVQIIKGAAFGRLVPLKDSSGLYFETETQRPPVTVSAVREISDITYYRILAAANVSATALERAESTEELLPPGVSAAAFDPPTDKLREITEIPSGAGYVPRGDSRVDVYEAAALQERARADHQAVLQMLARMIQERGGRTWYNNNIDLLGEVSSVKLLIEAKSLNSEGDAVHRMRYGIGQLLDYRYRYKAEVGAARSVLAFGRSPAPVDGWIASVLQENGVAFVTRNRERVVPLNDLAEALPIFS